VARTIMAASGKRWDAGAEIAEDMGEGFHSRGRGWNRALLAEQFLYKFYAINEVFRLHRDGDHGHLARVAGTPAW